MRLTDNQLKLHLNDDTIYSTDPNLPQYLKITPTPQEEYITGVTADLTLGNTFHRFLPKEFINAPLDLAAPNLSTEVAKIMEETPVTLKHSDTIVIYPGELLLGVTHESVRIPNCLVGWLDGRSSLARVGLQVHATAHRIDPGWDGKIVLEFINAGPAPLRLTVGMKICAISFETVGTIHSLTNELKLRPVATGYTKRPNSAYVGQDQVIPSRTSKD